LLRSCTCLLLVESSCNVN